jgi:hypothetical protein
MTGEYAVGHKLHRALHLRCYNLLYRECAAQAHPNVVLPSRSVGDSSRGVAQPGRAPGSGPGGRRFKSSLPDQ